MRWLKGGAFANLQVATATFAAMGFGLSASPAQAVPAFAEQTGLPCQACHVGGFGPQLTPYGRQFKLEGYTQRSKRFNLPFSAMGVASFTHTRTDQVPPPAGLSANDNLAFDQGSIFIAGGVGRHFGGLAQVTYNGISNHWSWDNLDLRAVTSTQLFGQDTTLGLSLNNAPTAQDVWNTTPAWGFPYTDTAVSPKPGSAPLIAGGLAGNTIGMSAYAWIGRKWYMEGGAYTSPAAGTLNWLGVDPAAPGDLAGLAPYGRIAWQGVMAGGTLAVGVFALDARLHPGRDRTSSFTDRYIDVGLDASWQKPLASGDTLSAQMRYIHEWADFRASCDLGLLGAGGAPDCARIQLNDFRGNISYNWRKGVGATLGGFVTTGDSNANLYGGPNARPNSSGVMTQIDYTPWGSGNSPFGARVNLRLGVQYTIYGQFNGARYNYDGAGANAADNNALRIFTWLAF